MYKSSFCEMDQYMLEEYIDCTLSRAEKLLIEAHIKTCADCRKYVNGLKLLIWDLEQAGKEPVDIPKNIEDFSAVIWENISSSEKVNKSNTRLILEKSSSSFRSAFAFTSYMRPIIKPGSRFSGTGKALSAISEKLRNKAVNTGRSYLKKRLSNLLGGRS